MISFFKSLFGGKKKVSIKDQEHEYIKQLKREMLKEVTNEIERLYLEGIDNIHKRKDFYKLFEETDFYFLGNVAGDKKENFDGSIITGKNTELEFSVFVIENKQMSAFFTSLEKLERAVKGTSYNKYVRCKFRNFFNVQYGYPFIMNPGFLMTRIFEPKEIASILDESIFKSFFPDIKAGTKLSIGIPANKPHGFLKKLVQYAQSGDVIEKIYLAQLCDDTNGMRLAIAIKFAPNIEGKAVYFDDIGKLLSGKIAESPFIDFTELNGKNETANLIKLYGECIY